MFGIHVTGQFGVYYPWMDSCRPHATLPVIGGRLELGTWQSVVLVDTNRDNPDRQVRLSFLG